MATIPFLDRGKIQPPRKGVGQIDGETDGRFGHHLHLPLHLLHGVGSVQALDDGDAQQEKAQQPALDQGVGGMLADQLPAQLHIA